MNTTHKSGTPSIIKPRTVGRPNGALSLISPGFLWSGILSKYIFREIAGTTVLIACILTGVLFLVRCLKLIEVVVTRSVSISEIAYIFSLVIPGFLEVALPLSLLLGVIISFGRFCQESEIVVLRAMGFRLSQVVKPVILLSVVVLSFSLFITTYLTPLANRSLSTALFNLAKKQISSGLLPGTFNKIGTLTIYSEDIQENGEALSKILVSDGRSPTLDRVFIARSGRIRSDDVERLLSLQLFDGHIVERSDLGLQVTKFDSNTVVISQDELLAQEANKKAVSRELSYASLQKKISAARDKGALATKEELHQANRLEGEIFRRLALPFSCMFISLLSISLGIQPARNRGTLGTSASIGLGVLAIVAYFITSTMMTALVEQGHKPIWVLSFIPDIVFFFLSLAIFRKLDLEVWQSVTSGFSLSSITSLFHKKRKVRARPHKNQSKVIRVNKRRR